MIGNHKVYILKSESTFNNPFKEIQAYFSPTILSETSTKALLDSTLCWKLHVEYKYSYIGYDADDDISKSDSMDFDMAKLLHGILTAGSLSVDSAIVIDDEENFVGVLLCKNNSYHLLSPFLPAHHTIKLSEREKIYPHREEETTATFSICTLLLEQRE